MQEIDDPMHCPDSRNLFRVALSSFKMITEPLSSETITQCGSYTCVLRNQQVFPVVKTIAPISQFPRQCAKLSDLHSIV